MAPAEHLKSSFQEKDWPDIKTGFKLLSRPEDTPLKLGIFHQSVMDWDTDLDETILGASQKECLEHFNHFLALHDSISDEIWYMHPDTIDYFVLYDRPNLEPEVIINICSYNTEEAVFLKKLPAWDEQRFIDLHVLPKSTVTDILLIEGHYVFNKNYLMNLLKDRKRAEQYVFSEPDTLEKLIKKLDM